MLSNAVVTGASDAPPAEAPPPTPTTTHYQEVARGLSELFATALGQVPMLERKHAATVKFVRSHSGFPNDFIATVLSAVEADPQLQRVEKFDVVEARDTLQFLEAFRPVIDQVEALLANLRFTCAARKARVVADGLQIYYLAKGLGRDPGSADVASHAKNMKRDLNRPGPRRSRKKEVPAPTTPKLVQ
jgi:hypothetical protein